jgi:hypothetical protein
MSLTSRLKASHQYLCAAILLLVLPSVVGAQKGGNSQPARNPTTDGTECFRAILHLARVEPLPEGDAFQQESYRGVILVMVGVTSHLEAPGMPQRNAATLIGRVIRDGGAVLLAPTVTSQMHLGNGPLPARGHWVFDPGDRRLVPLTPTRRGQPSDPEWAVIDGLTNLRLPSPRALIWDDSREPGRSALAGFPAGTRVRDPWQGGRPAMVNDPAEYPFAVGGSGRPDHPYRFLMLADPSVLNNQCLLDTTSDNLTLGQRVTDFLRDQGGVDRTRCLFFENGQYVPRFNVLWDVIPRQVPPIPQPNLDRLQEWLVDQGNATVDHVEQKNVLNNLLLGSPDDPDRRNRRLRGLIAGLFVVGSIWAAVWALRRVWKARHAADGPAPPATGVKPPTGTVGLFDRRQKELLRRNNVYEPVRDVVRDFFESAGAPPHPIPRPPRVVFADSAGRRAARLRRAIDDLWRVGYGRPLTVTVQRWQELEPQLEMILLAYEDGIWRFAGVVEGHRA